MDIFTAVAEVYLLIVLVRQELPVMLCQPRGAGTQTMALRAPVSIGQEFRLKTTGAGARGRVAVRRGVMIVKIKQEVEMSVR